jgi:hypothetical protein
MAYAPFVLRMEMEYRYAILSNGCFQNVIRSKLLMVYSFIQSRLVSYRIVQMLMLLLVNLHESCFMIRGRLLHILTSSSVCEFW